MAQVQEQPGEEYHTAGPNDDYGYSPGAADAGQREEKHPEEDPQAHSEKDNVQPPPPGHVPAPFVGKRLHPAQKVSPKESIKAFKELFHQLLTLYS